jgi:alpha-tubulin suppressor-like RCC1 family protein
MALKTDGTLWAWGRNDAYGRLGDGTKISKSTPVQIGSDTNWVAISLGGFHTVALKANGTLWAWGCGGFLGDGTYIDRYTPVQIGSDTNWSTIATRYENTVALKTDDTLWAWGGGNASVRIGSTPYNLVVDEQTHTFSTILSGTTSFTLEFLVPNGESYLGVDNCKIALPN